MLNMRQLKYMDYLLEKNGIIERFSQRKVAVDQREHETEYDYFEDKFQNLW